MNPRIKKLIGLLILLPGLFIYVFAAAALGERLPTFWLIRAIYFAFAGIIWALPMKYLIIWMNKEPTS